MPSWSQRFPEKAAGNIQNKGRRPVARAECPGATWGRGRKDFRYLRAVPGGQGGQSQPPGSLWRFPSLTSRYHQCLTRGLRGVGVCRLLPLQAWHITCWVQSLHLTSSAVSLICSFLLGTLAHTEPASFSRALGLNSCLFGSVHLGLPRSDKNRPLVSQKRDHGITVLRKRPRPENLYGPNVILYSTWLSTK